MKTCRFKIATTFKMWSPQKIKTVAWAVLDRRDRCALVSPCGDTIDMLIGNKEFKYYYSAIYESDD